MSRRARFDARGIFAELTSGSRRKGASAVPDRIAIGLVEKYGIVLAEVARQVGVSTSTISRIMQRADE